MTTLAWPLRNARRRGLSYAAWVAPQRVRDRVLVLLGLLGAWHLVSLFAAPWIPSPLATARRFVTFVATGDLWHHTSYTLTEAIFGFLLGGLPAVWLPFVLRRQATLRRILDPFLAAFYGIPKVALAPIFILWFGIGLFSKFVLVASIVFFVVFSHASAGLDRVSQNLVRTAQVFGASEHWIAREIVWPSAAPYIFTGLRVAVPQSLGGAVVGEMISSTRGLGYAIEGAAADFDPAGFFVAVLILVAIVATLNSVFDVAERRLFAWRPSDLTSRTLRSEV
jgi:ABC-type nitrate/sulfonate/bicarbonate transport system permease component